MFHSVARSARRSGLTMRARTDRWPIPTARPSRRDRLCGVSEGNLRPAALARREDLCGHPALDRDAPRADISRAGAPEALAHEVIEFFRGACVIASPPADADELLPAGRLAASFGFASWVFSHCVIDRVSLLPILLFMHVQYFRP